MTEPARAGLREEVARRCCPSALEVHVDPTSPRRRPRPAPDRSPAPDRGPGPSCCTSTCAEPRRRTTRASRRCSPRLHDEVHGRGDALMRPVRLDLDGFGSFRNRHGGLRRRRLVRPGRADGRGQVHRGRRDRASRSTARCRAGTTARGRLRRWPRPRTGAWSRLTFDVGPDRVRRRPGAAPARPRAGSRSATPGWSGSAPTGPARRRRRRRGHRRGRAAARALVRPLHPVRDPAPGRLRPVPALTAKERQDTLVDLLGIRVYREVANRERRRRRRPGHGPRSPPASSPRTRTRPRRRAPGRPERADALAGWPARWPRRTGAGRGDPAVAEAAPRPAG